MILFVMRIRALHFCLHAPSSMHRFRGPILLLLLIVTYGRDATVHFKNADVICDVTDGLGCYPAVFEATDVFQPILPGQSLTSGLHVRVNMGTGQKEAKLILDGESSDSAVQIVATATNAFPANSILEKSQYRFEDFESFGTERWTLFEEEQRSVIHLLSLLLAWRDCLDCSILVGLLHDLEQYAHGLENGRLIARQGGFRFIKDILQYTRNQEVLAEAANVLGAATQSNPATVEELVVMKFLPVVLRRLDEDDIGPIAQRRLLFLLSCALRGNPQLAAQFISELHGSVRLLGYFDRFHTLKARIKCIELLIFVMTMDNGDATWLRPICQRVHLMLNQQTDTERGSLESTLRAILETRDRCRRTYKELHLFQKLAKMKEKLVSTMSTEDSSAWNMVSLIDSAVESG